MTLDRLTYLDDGGIEQLPVPPTIARLVGITSATGTIIDDDEDPYVFLHYLGDPPYYSGDPPYHLVDPPCSVNEGDPTGMFKALLRDSSGNNPAPSAQEVTVTFYIEEANAEAGVDYGDQVIPVRVRPGDLEFSLPKIRTINNNDPVLENDPKKTFTVKLKDQNGAELGNPAGILCTIEDNDRVVISVNQATVDVEEGYGLEFSVTLDRNPFDNITLGYDVTPGTGTHLANPTQGMACPAPGVDGDFVGITGGSERIPLTHDRLVAFPLPPVITCNDSLTEPPHETLWLENVTVTGGYAIVTGPTGARGRIVDNDTAQIDVEDQSGRESETREKPETLTFDVSLVRVADNSHAELQEDVQLSYEFAPTDDTKADACADYDVTSINEGISINNVRTSNCSDTPVPKMLEGFLCFSAGTTMAQPIEVVLLYDYLVEGDETFELILTDTGNDCSGSAKPEGALGLGSAMATGTIQNLVTPTLRVSGFERKEGETGIFTVTLSNPRDETVTVEYCIEGISADDPGDAYPDFEMIPDTECEKHPPGEFSFPPGTTSNQIGVRLLHDTFTEAAERTGAQTYGSRARHHPQPR